MSQRSTGASNETPSTLAGSSKSSRDDGDILIKLVLEDSDMPEVHIDDMSKLDITSDNIDTQVVEDENTKKVKSEEGETIPSHKQSSSKSDSTKNASTEKPNTINSKSKLNFIWVANIPRNVKATDLKKLFNQVGKVSGVKILTNGKQLYGYVSMENEELAAKCISELNNYLFQGEIISVSRNRPDINLKNSENLNTNVDKTNTTKVLDQVITNKKDQILKKEVKTDDKAHTEKETKSNKLNSKVEENKKLHNLTKSDRTSTRIRSKTVSEKSIPNKENNSVVDQQKEITKLKTKINSIYAVNSMLKRRVVDMRELYDGVRVKYDNLKSEQKKVKVENREERRRLSIDKENFEKMKKVELARLDDERLALGRELSETKRLKEYFKLKIEGIQLQRTPKRGRSPLVRGIRSPRRRTSPITGGSAGLYRADQMPNKKYRRSEGYSREKTPPPPNLNSELRKISGTDSVTASRPTYFSDGTKRPGFEYRPSHGFQQANQPPKSSWIGAYPKDERRGNSNPDQGNTLNMRYKWYNDNGPLAPRPSSTLVEPPRGSNDLHYQRW